MLANLPASQVEAVLLHELAHIRRNDYLIHTLQRIFEALYFYHPGAWWMSHMARQEREFACDDAAIAAMSGDRKTYALALAGLEHFRTGNRMAIAANGGSLMYRIQRVLGWKTGAKQHAGWPALAATVAAAILLTGGAASVKGWPQMGPNEKWLNEDVVYLINDAERDAFERIASDEERQMFVQQFWERRGGEVRRKEHYRRIAYATERFGSWRSDRGRMYITYGPPDEIESHTTIEEWRYRHVPGVGDNRELTFVVRDGEFRLVPGKIK